MAVSRLWWHFLLTVTILGAEKYFSLTGSCSAKCQTFLSCFIHNFLIASGCGHWNLLQCYHIDFCLFEQKKVIKNNILQWSPNCLAPSAGKCPRQHFPGLITKWDPQLVLANACSLFQSICATLLPCLCSLTGHDRAEINGAALILMVHPHLRRMGWPS